MCKSTDQAFQKANEAINDYPPQRHAHDAMSSIEEVIKNAELNADLKCTFPKPWDSSELISKIKEEIRKLDE